MEIFKQHSCTICFNIFAFVYTNYIIFLRRCRKEEIYFKSMLLFYLSYIMYNIKEKNTWNQYMFVYLWLQFSSCPLFDFCKGLRLGDSSTIFYSHIHNILWIKIYWMLLDRHILPFYTLMYAGKIHVGRCMCI